MGDIGGDVDDVTGGDGVFLVANTHAAVAAHDDIRLLGAMLVPRLARSRLNLDPHHGKLTTRSVPLLEENVREYAAMLALRRLPFVSLQHVLWPPSVRDTALGYSALERNGAASARLRLPASRADIVYSKGATK